jgi:Protein of unknown function (DUF3276)
MEEGIEKASSSETIEREEIHSKAVRAGKRTYFFDVKATKRNDYYLTITESKKRFNKDGRFYYEKHKIFLYKEDFEKFMDGLTDVIEFIKTSNPVLITEAEGTENDVNDATEEYIAVDFEDLENPDYKG